MLNKIVLQTTTEALHGKDFFDLDAEYRRRKDYIMRGRKYEDGEKHDAPGAYKLVTNDSIAFMMDVLAAHDLRSLDSDEEVEPNRKQPSVDIYHQVKIANKKPHIDGLIVDSERLTREKGAYYQVLQRLCISDPQFFGEEDFIEQDFDYGDMKAQLRSYFEPTRKAPKRRIDGLLLEKLGIKSAAALDKYNRKKLIVEITKVVNFYMEETEHFDLINMHTYDAIPEIAEIMEEAKVQIAAGLQLDKSERRQINRALFEVLFPKQERANRPKTIPAEWVRGVLNVFNPAVHLLAFGLELGLTVTDKELKKGKGLLDKAGKLRPYYETILLNNAKKWRQLVPFQKFMKNIASPDDLALAIDLHVVTIMHEIFHLIGLHVPYKRLKTMSDEKWEWLAKSAIPVIQELYEKNPKLIQTSVNNKNIIKAFHAVRDSKDPVEMTSNIIRAMSILETYCDRGSMFFIQNFFKLQSYRKIIEGIGERFTGKLPVKVYDMFELDDKRKARQLPILGFTQADIEELEKALEADELRHPYVQLGDTPILPEEEEIYRKIWELVRHFALEGKYGVLDKEHFKTSPFVILSHSKKYGTQKAK